MEDRRRRDHLAARDRRLRRHLLRRRGGRLRGRPERRLRGHGRTLDPRGHDLPRRRRLPLHRRGADVDAHGARAHADHLPHPDPSPGSRPRLRRGAGLPLLAHPGARHLPVAGRRGELGTPPPRGREHGRRRSGDGPHQPAHPLRRHVGSRPRAVVHPQRRTRFRLLEVDGRRRHLGGDQRGSSGDDGEDGDRRLPGGPGPGVGADRGGRGRGRRLPLGRRRRELDAGEFRAPAARAGMVLHRTLRRSPGPRDRVRDELALPQVDRRGADVGDDPDAARGPPRPVDQPLRQPDHALRQRRGRDDHLQRG